MLFTMNNARFLAKKRVGFQISHESVIDSFYSDGAQKGRARVSAGAKIVWQVNRTVFAPVLTLCSGTAKNASLNL